MKNLLHIALLLRFWYSLVILLVLCPPVQADLNQKTSEWSFQTGIDAWRLYPSVKEDLEPGFVEANSNLLLPNSYATWNYKGNSPFVKATSPVMRAKGEFPL